MPIKDREARLEYARQYSKSYYEKVGREKKGHKKHVRTTDIDWSNPEEKKCYHRESYHKNKGRSANNSQLRRYGITLAERDAILASQLNRCAICGRTEPNGMGWHTDHEDLPDGKKHVRGILCFSCNSLIGHANHDIHVLHAAAKYLEHTKVDC